MNKIIGFLISKEDKEPNIDIFNVGLNLIKLSFLDYKIFIWGIGDIDNYKITDKYSLSFPLHDNLLDRNVLIYFKNENIIIENDWLGSIPVFYNQKEKIVSSLSKLCIKDRTIHNEGLSNFCEFGYSVFEQTIFTDVKFMRYYSKILISNKILKIEHKQDILLDSNFLSKKTSTEDVISSIESYMSSIEKKFDGDIIIPTSGGFDSRLLNNLIKDKSKIHSFTYGVSRNQSKSFEVVYAKKLSDIYGTKWSQIEINNYFKYIDKWFDLYGISTHAHGMYHIDFFSKIIQNFDFNNPFLLSGIFGDIWAGNLDYEKINSYKDIIKLAYNHNLSFDTKYLEIDHDSEIKKNFFTHNEKLIQKSNKIKLIFTIRMKLMLISYLTQLPEYFGLPVATPFLNYKIVHTTLSLPKEMRQDRLWQKNYFRNEGIYIEDMNLKFNKRNKIDEMVAKKSSFAMLDIDILSKYIYQKRLIKINKLLRNYNFIDRVVDEILNIPKVGGVLRKIGFKKN